MFKNKRTERFKSLAILGMTLCSKTDSNYNKTQKGHEFVLRADGWKFSYSVSKLQTAKSKDLQLEIIWKSTLHENSKNNWIDFQDFSSHGKVEGMTAGEGQADLASSAQFLRMLGQSQPWCSHDSSLLLDIEVATSVRFMPPTLYEHCLEQ